MHAWAYFCRTALVVLLVAAGSAVRANESKLKSIPLEIPSLNRGAGPDVSAARSVPLPKGWLPAGELDRVAIVETAKAKRLVPAQFEPAMTWADGSIAVLHVPFAVKWDAGVQRKYWLVRSPKTVQQPTATPADAQLFAT